MALSEAYDNSLIHKMLFKVKRIPDYLDECIEIVGPAKSRISKMRSKPQNCGFWCSHVVRTVIGTLRNLEITSISRYEPILRFSWIVDSLFWLKGAAEAIFEARFRQEGVLQWLRNHHKSIFQLVLCRSWPYDFSLRPSWDFRWGVPKFY